jgi:regulatory protein
MRKITAIEPQKKNPRRVNVHLEGEFAFGLSRTTAAWLQVGQTLDEEKVTALQAEDARETAYLRALHLLSYRARSQEEIRQNLRKHEVPEAVIEETLRRLEEEGLADDGKFAREWVENRSTFRPRSRRVLTMELRRKGLAEEAIQSALADGSEDAHLAYQAGLQMARRLGGLAWPEFRRKLGDFLARRGFVYEDIAPVVRRIWEEQNAAGQDGLISKDKDSQ